MSDWQARLLEERAKISKIDAQLLELLNRRAAHALEVGRIKGRLGRKVEDLDRERALLDDLVRLNSGPLGAEEVRAVFQSVIDQMKKIQRQRVEETT